MPVLLKRDIEVQKAHEEKAKEADKAALAELEEQEKQKEAELAELVKSRNTITQQLHG